MRHFQSELKSKLHVSSPLDSSQAQLLHPSVTSPSYLRSRPSPTVTVTHRAAVDISPPRRPPVDRAYQASASSTSCTVRTLSLLRCSCSRLFVDSRRHFSGTCACLRRQCHSPWTAPCAFPPVAQASPSQRPPP